MAVDKDIFFYKKSYFVTAMKTSPIHHHCVHVILFLLR